MKQLLTLLMSWSLVPAFAQPANNEPCTATMLQLKTGSNFCSDLNFSMTGATYNAAAFPPGGCQGQNTTPPDVWFKFIIPQGGKVTIYTSTQAGSPDNDAVLQVFRGTACGTLTYISCNDDATTAMPALTVSGRPPGETIYARIYQYNGGANGLYNICVTVPEPLDLTHNTGIGTLMPDSTLDVNGNFLVRGGARITELLRINKAVASKITSDSLETEVLSVPELNVSLIRTEDLRLINSGGGQGQILSVGSGGIVFPVTQPFYKEFNIFNPATVSIPAGTFNKKFGFNSGTSNGFYSAVDSMITIPTDGLYMFMVKFGVGAITGGSGSVVINLLRPGGLAGEEFFIGSSTITHTHTFTFTRRCTAGQKFYIVITNSTSTAVSFFGPNTSEGSYFKGYLISEF